MTERLPISAAPTKKNAYICLSMSTRYSRILAISIIALTGLMITGVALSRLLQPRLPHIELDRSRYPVVGVDLSAHNGIPDFDSLSAYGIDFAYLKASEGEGFRDPSFIRNYAAAKRTGINVGAYHFFRFDCDGRKQAVNLLRAIAGCALDLPVAIDVEESGNPAEAATELISARLDAMVSHIRSSGRKVIIYTNKNGDARFVRGHFDSIETDDPELWICSFTDPPLNRRQWTLWQHSHRSRIPGVKGFVDLNTFNGDRAAWERWLNNSRNSGFRPAE
jgi:lysozyme